MVNCELHASVIRLLPVTELAQEVIQNMEVCMLVYVMSASKSIEIWTFSKADFSLLHCAEQLDGHFEFLHSLMLFKFIFLWVCDFKHSNFPCM